jgi:DedD protein
MMMARKIITDEESKLKRQARRRLIGAIALTILIAVLLPMLLDKEPPAPQQDIELQIPNKDKAGEFVPKMVLPPLNSTASQPSSAPVIAPLLDVKPAQPAKVETKSAAQAVSSATEAKPLVDFKPQGTTATPAAKPEAKPKAEARPVAKPAAKPAVKPAEKSGTMTHSGFVIQVGAFVDAEKAKKLQEKLHKQGYPSYTETAGDKTRVRVGDYATQAEAEKIRRKLEIQGMQANVVNLK